MFLNVVRTPNNCKLHVLFLFVFLLLEFSVSKCCTFTKELNLFIRPRQSFFSFWIIINIFILLCNAFILKWRFHNKKKKLREYQNIPTKYFLHEVVNKQVPSVSHLMVCIRTSKHARFKIRM